MKVSLNWIKKFTEITVDNDEIVRRIAAQIAEVESIESLADKYQGLVVAEIVESKEHSDADKIAVCQVNIGSKTVQVCAGDKTLRKGDKVAYIPPGRTVPVSIDEGKPFVIEKRDIRGEESNGMLGSSMELAIGDDHEGVLKLDTEASNGTSFIEAYELDDVIIEVENKALTHRPDTFGVIGFAREVAGIQGVAFKSPDWLFDDAEVSVDGPELAFTIDNQGPEACPRFTAVSMSNVTVAPSPILMQSYLKRIGIKPINNIVDTTNYLMVESGQPMHAFDYDKVAKKSQNGAAMVVRYPKKGEKIEILGGRVIQPHDKAIMVATDIELISVGGSIGGAETEVDETSQNIILEVGSWDLYSIRKTSMAHGIFTDAVTRYIRGQDPAACAPVSSEALRMLQNLAGGKVASTRQDSFDRPRKTRTVKVADQHVNKLLGSDLSSKDMQALLSNVELPTTLSGSELVVDVPTWRPDLNIPEDLIEEIGRLDGYNKLPVELPIRSIRAVNLNQLEKTRRLIRQRLISGGANEVLTYSFVSEKLFSLTNQDQESAFRIRNALRPELQFMRTSLTPSLLEQVYPNVRRRHLEFALFELGKSHNKQNLEAGLPVESHSLALVYSADDKLAAKKYQGAAFYQAVNYLSQLLGEHSVTIRPFTDKAGIDDWQLLNNGMLFEPKRRGLVEYSGQPIGVVGEYTAAIVRAFKLPLFSAGFEIDISSLGDRIKNESTYTKLSKFPAIEQDVTVSIPETISYEDVFKRLANELATSSNIRVTPRLTDIYSPDNTTHKNYTFNLVFQSYERTLKTQEVSQMVESAGKAVEAAFAKSG